MESHSTPRTDLSTLLCPSKVTHKPPCGQTSSGSGSGSFRAKDFEGISFIVYRIIEPYGLRDTFSSVRFDITPVDADVKGASTGISFANLFVTDEACPYPELETISASNDHLRENESFFETVDCIVRHLSDTVTLNREYTSIVKKNYEYDESTNVSVGNLALGWTSTWHGEPDARVRAKANRSTIISTVNIVNGDESSESSDCEEAISSGDESDGNTIVIEAKLKISSQNLSQLIALSIVNSFTEHNIHPAMNSIVPSLLLNGHFMVICLYDCVNDILMLSQELVFRGPGGINKETVAMMWLVINHRKFLRCLEYPVSWNSGFRKYAERHHLLQELLHLQDNKNSKFVTTRQPIVNPVKVLRITSLPVRDLPPPPKKRKK